MVLFLCQDSGLICWDNEEGEKDELKGKKTGHLNLYLFQPVILNAD
jgi:hypothetical protein